MEAFRAFGPLERVFVPPLPAALLRSDDPAADSPEGVSTPWGRVWLALAVYPTVDIARHALVQCNAWGSGTAAAARMTSRATADCAELFLSGVGCVELQVQPDSAPAAGAATVLCEVSFARADAVEALTARIDAARSEAIAAASASAASANATLGAVVGGAGAAARGHVLVPAALPPLVGKVVPRLPLPVDQFQATHYAFDARSGLFYEATRGFYYDAISALYLDTTTWTYLRRDEGAVDKFEPWTPPLPPQPPPQQAPAAAALPQAGTGPASHEPAAAAASQSVPPRAAAVAAPLARPNTGTVSMAAAPAAAPPAITADVASVDASATGSLPLAPADTTSAAADTAPVANLGVVAVCEVCRRGFKTVEHLRKHEQQSDLHKQNVAAAAAASASSL